MASNDNLHLNQAELTDPILEDIQDSTMNSPMSWKLGLFLNIIPSVLSVIALIVAFVALTQHGGSNISVTSLPNTDPTSDRIWNIALGDTGNNQEYIDEKSGRVMGFQPDMINAVCTLANKNCRLIYDLYTNCWDSEVGQSPHGGVGLFSGWYDACTGWIASVARQRTFKFTTPHSRPSGSSIIVLADNPGNVNWEDVTGKKIGFLDGWAFDKTCFGQIDNIQGSDLSTGQIFHYPDVNLLIDALKSGEIDAGFVSNSPIQERPDITVLHGGMDWTCHGSAGVAMMMRQDNPMDEWWNPAVKRLMSTSKYREICQDVKDTHGHVPGLDPEKFCIDI